MTGRHSEGGTWVPSEEARRWLYGIASAVVPLLVILGLVTGEVAQAILTIVAAVLSVSSTALAGVNVSNPVAPYTPPADADESAEVDPH